jgi:ABC-2 type transport system ATP-binding protein
VRERVGFLPEHFRFHDWLRADEFLDWHGELYGMTRENRAKRIPEVLAMVGLGSETKNKLRTFSKGMQQRIGIAQALMNDPTIVFLDEPTSALDPIAAATCAISSSACAARRDRLPQLATC